MPNTTKQLEQEIIDVLQANHVCSFATVNGDKPMVRYMALFHDGLNLYLATNRDTSKVDELRANPNVHILVGYDGKPSSDIVQIQARAELCADDKLREKLWNENFKQWFEGPHDPEYIIIEAVPEYIEYSSDGGETKVWLQ
ncbi:General stress protein 26 [Paenibacillus algorifonticola]|uniref:General stress protein 26 n=1 Tax=Paenibacillus algorifonticola TaxID=684063 RepID=A0A1I2DXR4_9BACL|nr:pyridoxamine 5'-phosphate oxidase family protein [Paenibacillus algorifonticola]SFE85492.1 General stress protein 26 [Paenibacillus algorifonticola]